MARVRKIYEGNENTPLVEAVQNVVGAKVIRARIEPHRSVVIVEDYSPEQQQAQELITKYVQLRSQLTGDLATDEPILVEMGMIAKQFEDLTGLKITEVV